MRTTPRTGACSVVFAVWVLAAILIADTALSPAKDKKPFEGVIVEAEAVTSENVARWKREGFRAKRGGKMTIPAAIHQVLSNSKKPMRPVEIRNAILERKLIKNVKKSFSIQVSHALSSHKEFKKKGRGLYSV